MKSKLKTLILSSGLLLAQIVFSQAPNQVTFRVKFDGLKSVKNPGIRGNQAPLSWEKSYPLTDWDRDGVYEGTVTFAGDITEIEYKFVHGAKTQWELSSGNRMLRLDGSIITDIKTWNVPDEVDVDNLLPLSAQQLLQDFDIAKRTLEAAHPGLYRYHSKEEMLVIFDEFEKRFSKEMSHEQAYVAFSELLANIQCSHTFANYYNQSPLIKQAVIDLSNKLPFTHLWTEDGMIITHSTVFESGSKVISINGYSIKEIQEALTPILRRDGHNQSKSLAELTVTGMYQYETFDVYFPLLFPPEEGKYRVRVVDPSLSEREEVVSTVSRAERIRVLNDNGSSLPTNDDGLWSFEIKEDGVAYLKLGTFDDFGFSFEWKEFLAEAFKQIRKEDVRKLILDIRWNEGGHDEIIGYLAGFLGKKDMQLVQREDHLAFDKIPEALRPYMSTWSPKFYDLSDEVKSTNKGYFVWKDQEEDKVPLLPKRFEGDVYLLTNGANSSASFFLAEAAKDNKLAILIGEETGGNRKGINGGMMFFVHLPNSKIHFDIPVIGMFSEELPDEGIVPDFIIKTNAQSIAAGVDPVLQKALSLATEN